MIVRNSAAHSPTKAHQAVVLVVDDEAMIVEEIVEYLHFTGIHACGTASACRVLALLELWPSVRVLVADLRMPTTDGFNLLRNLATRLGPQRDQLRVIILTGHATPADEEAARAAGAWGFIRKPCSLAELRSAVVAALDQASAEAASEPMSHRNLLQENGV